MHIGQEAHFVGVNIAQTGHDFLVEQGGFDFGFALLEPGSHGGFVEIGIERLRSHRGNERQVAGDTDRTESARVCKNQGASVLKSQNGVNMLMERGGVETG